MRKSNFISIVTFLSVGGYIVAGFLVAMIFGEVGFGDAVWLLPIALISALIFGGIVYVVSNKFIWKNGATTTAKLFSVKTLPVIGLIAIFGAYQSYATSNAKLQVIKKEEARWNALTEEQKKAELDEKKRKIEVAEAEKIQKSKVKEQDTKRFVFARVFVRALKEQMRDPESFKVENIRVNEEASIACIEYRAKNGFGGMNKEYAVYKSGALLRSNASAWNTNCTKSMYDMTYAAD